MIIQLLLEVEVMVAVRAYCLGKCQDNIYATKSTQSTLGRQYNEKCVQPLNSIFANK